MYNVQNVGKCRVGLPVSVPVHHVQWKMGNYGKILSKVDIGIVPNLMPIRNIEKMKNKASLLKNFFNDSEDDYLIRYKMPSNPGRIIVFGKLGVPVVTDFYPSALQTIQDGVNGRLVCSPGGWYAALKELIEKPDLRMVFAERLRQTIKEKYDYNVQNKNAILFFKGLISGDIRKDETPYGIEQKMTCRSDLKFKLHAYGQSKVHQWKHRLKTIGSKVGIK
jgi:hypothetical protein